MSNPGATGQIGLEYLSVFGMPVLEYAELAAQLECDFISLNLAGAPNLLEPYSREDLRTDQQLRKRLKHRVASLGLRICLIEGFAITAERTVAYHESDLDSAAELGASAICAVSLDRNLDRTFEQFAMLSEAARSRELLVTTEIAAGVIRNIAAADQALKTVAQQNFKLLVDTMHFFRSGASLDDLDKLPVDAIGHVQLCDVPMPAQIENYMEEALFERRGLGGGDLPLQAFIQKISPSIPIGLEIPIRSLAERGVTPLDRLQRSAEVARKLSRR